MQVIGGGRERGAGNPGLLHLAWTATGARWTGWPDATMHVDLMTPTGNSISDRVGDLQTLDNAEAHDTVSVFEAWYQRDFRNTGYSLRLGVQDYNALFDSLGAAGVFLNSSFGIDPTISQSNVSIYPTTGLGAVLQWKSPAGVYAMGGLYDGVPGLPGHPNGTHLELRRGDGVFSAFETGLEGDDASPFKLGVGVWLQTSVQPDPQGRLRRRDHGVYLIGQTRLWRAGAGRPAVDGFVQWGSAAPGNLFERYIGLGVEATGVFLANADDVLGLGLAHARVSTAYRRTLRHGTAAETALELTWDAPVTEHLRLQPDLQYIIDPGADANLSNALVAGVRVHLAL